MRTRFVEDTRPRPGRSQARALTRGARLALITLLAGCDSAGPRWSTRQTQVTAAEQRPTATERGALEASGRAARGLANCPACLSRAESTPFEYGPITAERITRARQGEILLGGCCEKQSDPHWRCNACGHEFR